MQESLFVANRDQAARIANLSTRQVDYWATTGLVVPSVDARLTPHRPIKLFSFLELMALMVAAELRARNVSLQHIRALVGYLKRLGYEQPLTELVYATEGRNVYFQHPDGTWEGGRRPGQSVMPETIDLKPLRRRIHRVAGRAEDAVGQTERRRGAMGSKEVVAGTRVPVTTVRRYLDSGRTVDEVVRSFPALHRADVEAIAARVSA